MSIRKLRTSFALRALLVKSLQHDVKHRSTSPEYNFMKSCIYTQAADGLDIFKCVCHTSELAPNLLSLDDF